MEACKQLQWVGCLLDDRLQVSQSATGTGSLGFGPSWEGKNRISSLPESYLLRCIAMPLVYRQYSAAFQCRILLSLLLLIKAPWDRRVLVYA